MNNRRPSQTEEKSDESGDEPLGDEIEAIAEEEEDEVGICSVFRYNFDTSQGICLAVEINELWKRSHFNLPLHKCYVIRTRVSGHVRNIADG